MKFLLLVAVLAASSLPVVAGEIPPDGGTLRIKYPTDGNRDILIRVDSTGAVVDVSGGASDVSSFEISTSRLKFKTTATTDWGGKRMEFDLGAKADGYEGEYNIVRGCQVNCTRTATATWE